MIERTAYYLDLLITLCGFNGTDDSIYFGWGVVLLSTGLVVYAFYLGINNIICPGENDQTHIKYQIFETHELETFQNKEVERAH